MMGGVGGNLAAVFGVFWTISAASMGAPKFMVGFGVCFILCGIGSAIYNFYNATQKNRMSLYDITSNGEEVDPVAELMGHERHVDSNQSIRKNKRNVRKYEGNFCPYCGEEAKSDFDFCPKCGKDI